METDSVRPARPPSEVDPHSVDKLVVLAIHQRAKGGAIIRKPNPSRHGNGDAVAVTIPHEIANTIHPVRSEEPIETEGAEGDAQLLFPPVQRHQNGPLIVDHSRANHQLEGFDPELTHSLAGSNEGSCAHDRVRSTSPVSHGEVDATPLEQAEDLVGRLGVAGIHLRIDHEADVERRIRVVERARAPLLAAATIVVPFIDLVKDVNCIEEFLRCFEVCHNGHLGLFGYQRGMHAL